MFSHLINDLSKEKLIEMFEENGLFYAGQNEDGELEWIGTDNAWKKCKELTSNL
jgi:hypothetical protein